MDIIKKAIKEVKKVDKPENNIDIQRFFKEKVEKRYVLKWGILKKIVNACYNDIKSLSKKEILDICDKFFL